MSNSSPDSDSTAVLPSDATVPVNAEPAALSGSVEVFDPAMCCPTGVCGPGVDPALLQIARDLRWLASRGARVVRVGLSQEPRAFVDNARVNGLLQAFGDAALPAVLVNGAVLAHGRYPSRDEVIAALTPQAVVPVAAPVSRRGSLLAVDTAEGCCTPGSGCC